MTRREFLAAGILSPLLPRALGGAASVAEPPVDRLSRVCGLIFGGAVGDALGGPIEFQDPARIQALPRPPRAWKDPEEQLDAAGRKAAAGRLFLRSYADLRPQPESYGQWNVNAAPGTITDDTRHKLVLLHALHAAETTKAWPLGVKDLARSYLEWPATPAVTATPAYAALAADWLEEWQLGARWVLGERDPVRALPPERMWVGLPTCCGQMTSLPIAALFPGQPEKAYRAAYELGYFDNGWGRDLNAAIVAGLATALATPLDPASPARAWGKVLAAMRETDPFAYRKVRWTQRAVDRWLDLALKLAADARGRPARLFAALEEEFKTNSKWEAQVPFVVTFACLAIADHDPLAALALSLEWGHDSDSYAQLVGAFVGALHGVELLRPEWVATVRERLLADHGVDLDRECLFLERLAEEGRTRSLIAGVG